MKDKLIYIASIAVVISTSVFALKQVENGSLLPSATKQQASMELAQAPETVSGLVAELKDKYPHIKESCILGSAMVLHGMADKVKNVIEAEAKCIHSLVIYEGQKEQKEQNKFSEAE